ncbi:MAG: hypothetical protein EBV83_08260, partial [Verrucomicrobia bacterium]|nr:hypothetical protein [Verrucomicrobiota bacterium]
MGVKKPKIEEPDELWLMKLPSPRRASCGSLLIALLVCGATPGLTQAGTVPATEIPDGSRVSLQTVGVFPNLQMPAAMELSGDRAYVLDSKGLSIFDISRPDRPEMLGTTPASGNFLALGDGLALVGVPGSFSVIDVRNPSHPTNVAQHSVRMQVSMTASVALTGLAMNGRLAYVGFPGGGLMVYDLSDPAKLEFRGGLNPSGDPGFSGYGGGGITSLHEEHVVVTQTDFYGPTRTPKAPDGVRLVKKESLLSGKILTDNPPSFWIQGVLAGRTGDTRPGKAAGFGRLLLVPAGALGLMVFDLSSTLPDRQYFPKGPALDVSVSGSRAFLACGSEGVNIVDVGQPEALRSLGGQALKASVNQVRTRGDFIYALTGDNEIQILRMIPETTPLKRQTITWSTPIEIVENPRVPLVAKSSSGLPIHFKVLGSSPIKVEIKEETESEYIRTGPLMPILKTPTYVGNISSQFGLILRPNILPITVDILASQVGDHEYLPTESRRTITLVFATRIAIEPDPSDPDRSVLVKIPTTEAVSYVGSTGWSETKPAYRIEGSTNLVEW